jgi:hypothetical protein
MHKPLVEKHPHRQEPVRTTKEITMIYRVAKNVGDGSFAAAKTSRPPGNIPFYVDNIWEWLRPAAMASRRKAAFASPTPELAALAAQGDVADAWVVELVDAKPAYQIVNGLRPQDAKFHDDVARLKRVIIGQLRKSSWFDLPLTQRGPESHLFAPCLSQPEVESIFEASNFLQADEIRAASTFWADVRAFEASEAPLHPTGEIFFEGAYRLSRIK